MARAFQPTYLVPLLGLLSIVLSVQPAAPQSIWFGPRWAPPDAPLQMPDYMDLFEPNAPWQKAASVVEVFEISPRANLVATEADLTKVFAYLRARHIDLVVGISPVTSQGPGYCGHNVEGYSLPLGTGPNAKRIKLLGADPRYYVMDEPLYFGHVFDRERDRIGCRLPIDQVARDVAEKLRQVRTIFPNARFGDVEPFPIGGDTWLADLTTWFDEYERATGDKLAFFRLDLQWSRPWQVRITALRQRLREKGIPFQVIYNGSGQDPSDEAWTGNAVTRFKEFESGGRSPPDAALIEFWTPHPSHLLPETDPGTATWLINRYADWRKSRP